MTDFKVGDRVRATLGESLILGTMRSVAEDEVLVDADGDKQGVWLDRNSWHIEKVSPPLPTKVGAIVRHSSGQMFVRDAEEGSAHWLSLDGRGHAYSDRYVSAGGFEVIFEGIDQ